MRPIRLLLAESVPLLRGLLAEHLGRQDELELVAVASNGGEAVEKARDLRPAVALLGLELDGVSGAEAAARMRANLPGVGLVLLTTHPRLLPLGVWCGASECLSSECAPDEIVAAVRRAARSAPLASALPASTNRAGSVERLVQQSSLSEKERAVVEKMVLTELTTAQIARLLSHETGIVFTDSAVKHAMERALHKMSIEPRTRTALMRRVLDSAGHDRASLR